MTPQRRLRLQQIALSLGTVVVLLGALETAARVRQRVRYGTFAGTVHVQEVDPDSGLAVPTPGVIAGDAHRIEINAQGFRSPPLPAAKPEGLTRLAFLGGSTTFCAEASDNDSTWPHLVVEGLREAFPGARFDFLNAAVGGYAVHHSLLNLRTRVAPWHPDVIVIYHAVNDLSYATTNLAMAQGLDIPQPWSPSWLARHSLLWNLCEKNLRMRSTPTAPVETLDPDPSVHAAGFEAVLTELVEAAQGIAPLVVIATFSHRARPEQSASELENATRTARFYTPALDAAGILRGIEAYNEVIRRVARARGCVLVEGEHTIPADDTHFADSVHLTDAGCRVQARRVVEAMVGAGEVRRLLQAEGASRD